ncbi:transposase domain-containing protein [Pseudarthrobacter sp. P1]|uniref:transposase domain-containing protein n=1 Tax=Pseudarthrobacter sp. P1 TaxID=3418418 RepID=UPI003CEE5532
MARSGGVTPEGPERLSDHVSIGVLTRVFPPDVVDAVIERTGAMQQRNRLLPSRLMVYYVMSLALFSAGSYEEVMRSLLWRVKASNLLPVVEELADGSYLSDLYASPKDRRKDTDPVRVRVIEYTVTTGEEVSGFRLITTLLDPEAAPAQDLAGAYARRWEIESSFDELKTRQRGPGMVLRSKTPGGVLQEIYGHLCVHYAIRSLIGSVARHFEEDPLRFSFTRTLRAAKRSLAGRPAFSPSTPG